MNRGLAVSDDSAQPVSPIFKGQAVLLTLEDGIDRLSRNVGGYQSICVTSYKGEYLIHTAAEA